MVTRVRRVFWLLALGGGAFAGWTAWSRRTSALPAAPPEWPPIEPPARETTHAAPPSDNFLNVAERPETDSPVTELKPPAAEAARLVWVASDAGACPATHPIKANDNSGIYHVPGGRFYERTGAERCYALADDAEADGYRRAKN